MVPLTPSTTSMSLNCVVVRAQLERRHTIVRRPLRIYVARLQGRTSPQQMFKFMKSTNCIAPLQQSIVHYSSKHRHKSMKVLIIVHPHGLMVTPFYFSEATNHCRPEQVRYTSCSLQVASICIKFQTCLRMLTSWTPTETLLVRKTVRRRTHTPLKHLTASVAPPPEEQLTILCLEDLMPCLFNYRKRMSVRRRTQSYERIM